MVRICLQCQRSWFDPWVGRIPWRREWQPTPVLLPGEFHRRRSLMGPWGRKELDTAEWRTLPLSRRDMREDFSPMCRHSKMIAIYEPGWKLLPGSKPSCNPRSWTSSFRTVTNKCLLFKQLSLQCSWYQLELIKSQPSEYIPKYWLNVCYGQSLHAQVSACLTVPERLQGFDAAFTWGCWDDSSLHPWKKVKCLEFMSPLRTTS